MFHHIYVNEADGSLKSFKYGYMVYKLVRLIKAHMNPVCAFISSMFRNLCYLLYFEVTHAQCIGLPPPIYKF